MEIYRVYIAGKISNDLNYKNKFIVAEKMIYYKMEGTVEVLNPAIENQYCWNCNKLLHLRFIKCECNKYNLPVLPILSDRPRNAKRLQKCFQQTPWITWIIQGIKLLLLCECVIFLPDWRQSKGAVIEFIVSLLTFKKIGFLNDKGGLLI